MIATLNDNELEQVNGGLGPIGGAIAGALAEGVAEVMDDKPGVNWGNVATGAAAGAVTGGTSAVMKTIGVKGAMAAYQSIKNGTVVYASGRALSSGG